MPNAVLFNAKLSPGARVIYAALVHVSWKSTEPSQEEIGKDVGLSGRMVRRYLVELVEAGLVTATRRGRGRTNSYSIARQATNVLSSGTEDGPETSSQDDDDRTDTASGDGTDVADPLREKKLEEKAAAALVEPELQQLFEDIGCSARRTHERKIIAAVYATRRQWVLNKTLELRQRTKKPVADIAAVLVASIEDGEHLKPARIEVAAHEQARRSAESWYANVAHDLPDDAFEEELAGLVKRGLALNDAEAFRERHAQDAAELADAA